MRKFPTLKFALAEGAIGWYPYWLEKADFVYQHHHRWTGQDFGDKLPSQVFRDRVLVCFIDDVTGLELRHRIGIDNLAWECDYPHSDSTWPTAPETLMKSFEEVGVPDDEIHKISWENACAFYKFDPLAHIPREQCTVGALRAQAVDVDTTARRYGTPPDEESVEAAKQSHFADPPGRR
jgi:Amidohydrolase